MKTAVCIGTGPSLTLEQIDRARSCGFALFGCNLTYQIVPDLQVFYACNVGFWDTYWRQGLAEHPADKWTTNWQASKRYSIGYIEEVDAPGLSTDSRVIHHGHGSGYSLVSMAHWYGYERIYLLGYDLRYPQDYDPVAKKPGSGQRHYFGEYPEQLQHWPSVQVRNGVHVELVELYKSIVDQGLVQLICATPGSALEGVIPSETL